MQPLARLDKIASQLGGIDSIDEAKSIRDKAEALRVYYQTYRACRRP